MRRWMLVLVAGCVPSNHFEFAPHPETEAVIYLIVPNCLPAGDKPNEGDGCNAAAGPPFLAASEASRDVAFNLGYEDRLFIGEYRQPVELLGLPRSYEGPEECDWRSFPPVITATQFDLESRDSDLASMPNNRRLPPFTYDECFGAGRCLGLLDGVPICSDECTEKPDVIEARGAISSAVGSIAGDAAIVESCAEGGFDFAARKCMARASTCDPADRFPRNTTATVFIDPDAPVNGTGTRDSPYNAFGGRALTETVIAFAASSGPLVINQRIDRPKRFEGCWDGSKSITLNPGGMPIEIAADVSMSEVVAAGGLTVSSGSLALDDVEVRGHGLSVLGGSARLEDVILRNTSTTAVRAENGTIRGRNLYVYNSSWSGIECDSCTIELAGLSLTGVRGSGVEVRDRSSLELEDASLALLSHHGILIDSSTATLTRVRVSGYGGDSAARDRSGIRLRRAMLRASAVRVADANNRRLDDDRIAIAVLEGSVLELDRAAMLSVGDGVHVMASEALLREIAIDDAIHDGIAFRAGSSGTITDARIECVERGLLVEDSSLAGEKITALTVRDPSLCEPSDGEETRMRVGIDVVGNVLRSEAELEDVVVSGAIVGVSIGLSQAENVLRLTGAKLEDVGDPSAGGGGIEIGSGQVELGDVSIAPAPSSAGFILTGAGATSIEATRVIVQGGVDTTGIEVPGEADVAFDQVSIELDAFDAFFENPAHVITVERCRRPDLPHALAAGIGVSGLSDSAVHWVARGASTE